MWMILTYFVGIALLLVGWIVGEYAKLQWLRVGCVLVLFPLFAAAPFALGKFSGAAEASISASGALDRFLDVAVEQLDAEREDRVHKELRTLTEAVGETYEGGAFVSRVDAATERLKAP
ncbi:MAG: hypothetical protein AAF750_02570 [Planctomycetota bacterium]